LIPVRSVRLLVVKSGAPIDWHRRVVARYQNGKTCHSSPVREAGFLNNACGSFEMPAINNVVRDGS
jgi:hypothetical protein